PPAQRAASVHLRFTLPQIVLLRVEPGRWLPCMHQVRVDVARDRGGTVACFDAMESYAALQVMEQAVRFLNCAGRLPPGTPAQSAIAELSFASREERPQFFSIMLGARVAIAPRERWQRDPVMLG